MGNDTMNAIAARGRFLQKQGDTILGIQRLQDTRTGEVLQGVAGSTNYYRARKHGRDWDRDSDSRYQFHGTCEDALAQDTEPAATH